MSEAGSAQAGSAPDEGEHRPERPAGFDDLGLDERVVQALRDVGYEDPTPIQAATIPVLLTGRDVVGLAQTGTGKTAGFALPILSRIDLDQGAPQALVLTPTRELALQVSEAFESYSTHLPGLRLLPVYGGQGYAVQLSALRRGVQVVVGTPGRIIDHLQRGTLDLSQLRFLVLDEADEMLNMGFAEEVETILAKTPPQRQVALFCATMPNQIRRLSKKYLNDAAEVTIQGSTATAPNISQRYLIVSYPQKVDALTRILEVEPFDKMIVFVRTKNESETLAEKLRARGLSATAINGDLAQAARERTIEQLRNDQLDILVATDVAARGLDVERVSHVVNFDIPTDVESYVHRIGRTGRAGREGEAISFVTPRERHLLRAIERATRQPLTQMSLPSVDDVNATRLSRFDSQITAARSDDRLAFFRDVVGHYVDEYDVPDLDVAAALAVVLQGNAPLLLEPDPEPSRRERVRADPQERSERTSRERRDFGDDDRGRRPERIRGDRGVPMATYRIAVGKRHKIGPKHIVGALANEAGLNRDDFGYIDIRPDHSLIDLPARLPDGVWDALKTTRISGRLIDLRLEGHPRHQGHGGAGKYGGPSKSGGPGKGGKPFKPRGKSWR